MVININADFVAQADVQTPVAATGVWGDATGVADFVFRIAATRTGAAIHATLTGTASVRASDANRYYRVFDKADLTTHLASYVGRRVYVVLSRSGDLDGLYWPARVVDSVEGG